MYIEQEVLPMSVKFYIPVGRPTRLAEAWCLQWGPIFITDCPYYNAEMRWEIDPSTPPSYWEQREIVEDNPSKLNVYYITGNGFIVVHDLQYTYTTFQRVYILYIEDIRYTHTYTDHISHCRVLTVHIQLVSLVISLRYLHSPRVFWLITLRLKSRHHMRAWNNNYWLLLLLLFWQDH